MAADDGKWSECEHLRNLVNALKTENLDLKQKQNVDSRCIAALSKHIQRLKEQINILKVIVDTRLEAAAQKSTGYGLSSTIEREPLIGSTDGLQMKNSFVSNGGAPLIQACREGDTTMQKPLTVSRDNSMDHVNHLSQVTPLNTQAATQVGEHRSVMTPSYRILPIDAMQDTDTHENHGDLVQQLISQHLPVFPDERQPMPQTSNILSIQTNAVTSAKGNVMARSPESTSCSSMSNQGEKP